MQLTRALELCQEPINASKSHIVRVDRYALVHTLADRMEVLAENKALKGALAKAEDNIVKLREEATAAGIKADALEKATKANETLAAGTIVILEKKLAAAETKSVEAELAMLK